MENENIENGDEEQNEALLEKERKLEIEKKEFLNNVLSGNIKILRDKVGYILNRYNSARNSDIELAWRFWEVFEPNFEGKIVTEKQMLQFTRINSLTRSRAKIQNEFKLFQADDTVKKFRGVLEQEKRLESIEDKPTNIPAYTVFVDETGKTQQNLSVGSLWIIDENAASFHVNTKINDWKKQNEINYEFHFAEVSKNKVQHYKDFFTKFISLNPTAGFKLISIKNSGFRDLSQPITDLTFHLLNNGINHEHRTHRATLPRTLQVWIDEDEVGSDSLKLENLKERLKAQQIEGLYIENFFAISSHSNYYIQAVDLFTASVNRQLNRQNGSINHKDELADFILSIVNFNINEIDSDNSNIDNSTVFNLSGFTEK